jgi:F0F1-type ATP synthase assembly protein I
VPKTKTKAYRVLVLQLALTLVLAIVWGAIRYQMGVVSVMAAAAVCLLPNWLFVKYFFADKRRDARQTVTAFYGWELLRFGLTVVLALLVLMLVSVQAAPFFCSLLVIQLGFWLSPLLLRRNNSVLSE